MKLHSTFLNLLTNEEMTKTYEENASRLGIQTDTDKESILKKLGGSTDVGNVSYEVPTIHPEFEIGADCNTHSMDFTTAAGKDCWVKLVLILGGTTWHYWYSKYCDTV